MLLEETAHKITQATQTARAELLLVSNNDYTGLELV